MKSIYYQRTYELLLRESMLSQGYSEDQINEAFIKNISGFAGAPLGYLKRAIGSREDFAHNYNSVIDRSNALRRSRGQPTLKYWGGKETWDKPKVETTPDKTPDISPEEPKTELAPENDYRQILTKGGYNPDQIGQLRARYDKGEFGDADPVTIAREFAKFNTVNPEDKLGMQNSVAVTRANRMTSGVQKQRDDLARKIKTQRASQTRDATNSSLRAAAAKYQNDEVAASRAKAGMDPVRPKRPEEINMGMLDKGQRGDIIRARNNPLAALIASRKKDLSSTYYGEVTNLIRESFQINEKKGPCWKGYEAVGMKMKGGRKVPNCVPKKK